MHGKSTYGELVDSPERIPTNILADRLKRLEEAGLILKSPYQERPVHFAYALSEKGMALGDVLLAFVRWGKKYVPGTRTLTEIRPHAARGAPGKRPGLTRAKARRAR